MLTDMALTSYPRESHSYPSPIHLRTSGLALAAILVGAVAIRAAEYHVAIDGNDANPGSKRSPFRHIQYAAERAQPGDTITVHAGVYRERINPPRGGTSDAKRITFQAARGEKAVITGSEIAQGWTRTPDGMWTVKLPNSLFGSFNPYSDLIHGDWFDGHGRPHHTGAVYLNGESLIEAASFEQLSKPATHEQRTGVCLLNIAWFQPAGGAARIPADRFAAKHEMNTAPCSEGGQCLGWIEDGDWARYDRVDFGGGAEEIEFRAASITSLGMIELRLDSPAGELLGTCPIANTGDWQAWQSFKAKIKPVRGVQNLCLVFRSSESAQAQWFGQVGPTETTLWAQFGNVNPNEGNVEINVRQTVFTPEKTGVNFTTVRGFQLRNAATPWAPPTAAQIGLVSAFWNKGWIIENNEICYSKCCGVALGKYGDEYDNRAESAEGYVGTLTRALTNGWNRATVGGHLVRNNHIHHCEQTGVVGSLGCSFSTVTGNVIHDIHYHRRFGGAEMAGIKFHGAIDVIISYNHIYRCGEVGGIWLDWMGQGAQVVGNLLHDNTSDLFSEMQHGPLLIANNLFLSKGSSLAFNAQGMAVVHNLIVGRMGNHRSDTRITPFQKAHSTEIGGMHADSAANDSGDHRFYNNLFLPPCRLSVFNNARLPCLAAGNVYVSGAQPAQFETSPVVKPDFDVGGVLEQKPDGWYLRIALDRGWRDEAKAQLVTTAVLGKAQIPDCAYENADGSALRIDSDYFGKRRDRKAPFPGPFEPPREGAQTIKVWPRF